MKKTAITWDDKRHIINMLLLDDDLFRGGIPSTEQYLTSVYGLTPRKAGEISHRLYSLTKAIK
jgi:hypothetical protein